MADSYTLLQVSSNQTYYDIIRDNYTVYSNDGPINFPETFDEFRDSDLYDQYNPYFQNMMDRIKEVNGFDTLQKPFSFGNPLNENFSTGRSELSVSLEGDQDTIFLPTGNNPPGVDGNYDLLMGLQQSIENAPFRLPSDREILESGLYADSTAQVSNDLSIQYVSDDTTWEDIIRNNFVLGHDANGNPIEIGDLDPESAIYGDVESAIDELQKMNGVNFGMGMLFTNNEHDDRLFRGGQEELKQGNHIFVPRSEDGEYLTLSEFLASENITSPERLPSDAEIASVYRDAGFEPANSQPDGSVTGVESEESDAESGSSPVTSDTGPDPEQGVSEPDPGSAAEPEPEPDASEPEPEPETEPEPEPEPVTYEVQAGDNLWTISEARLQAEGIDNPTDAQIQRYSHDIIDANPDHFRNADGSLNAEQTWIIHPGDELNLPGVDGQSDLNESQIADAHTIQDYADSLAPTAEPEVLSSARDGIEFLGQDALYNGRFITSHLETQTLPDVDIGPETREALASRFEAEGSPDQGIVSWSRAGDDIDYAVWTYPGEDGELRTDIISGQHLERISQADNYQDAGFATQGHYNDFMNAGGDILTTELIHNQGISRTPGKTEISPHVHSPGQSDAPAAGDQSQTAGHQGHGSQGPQSQIFAPS